MRDHGTRAKYVAEKCRCTDCRKANSAYRLTRDRHLRRVAYGLEEQIYPFAGATETREHLQWLESVGVGSRAVAAAAGLSRSAVRLIRSGTRQQIRPETADKILAVGRSKAAPGAYIDAKNSWELIADLLAHGHTKKGIARALGSIAMTPQLQLRPHQISAGKARQIKQLHRQLMFRVIEDRRLIAEARAHYRALEKERA